MDINHRREAEKHASKGSFTKGENGHPADPIATDFHLRMATVHALLAAVAPAAPPLPARGDVTEAWLKAQRDAHADGYDSPPPEWFALDAALHDYRLHADTGTPLGERVPCRCSPADCAGCADEAVAR